MQINSVWGRMRAVYLCTHRKKGQLLTNWFDVKKGYSFPCREKTLAVVIAITLPTLVSPTLPLIPSWVLNLRSKKPPYATFPPRTFMYLDSIALEYKNQNWQHIHWHHEEAVTCLGYISKTISCLLTFCCLLSPSVTYSRFFLLHFEMPSSQIFMSAGKLPRSRQDWNTSVARKDESIFWRKQKRGDALKRGFRWMNISDILWLERVRLWL